MKEVIPQHKVCSSITLVPKIVIESLNGESLGLEVWLQWFGESDIVDLEGMQFRFPIPLSVNNVLWMNHPDLFEVVFVGPVKEWPKKEAMAAVANTVTNGDLGAYVFWFVSSHYTQKYPSGVGPASIMVPMNTLLADSFGIIMPKSYTDLGVLERAVSRVKSLK